jgi:hypothetical protein
MAQQNLTREQIRAELYRGNARPAHEFNRKAESVGSKTGYCGGCIGAGTGTNCCICGRPR